MRCGLQTPNRVTEAYRLGPLVVAESKRALSNRRQDISRFQKCAHELPYDERVVRCVANNTHQQRRDFLELATSISFDRIFEAYPTNECQSGTAALKMT